jgi:ribose-phosphate pyrophosphokinase
MDNGALSVIAACTHGVLSGPAVERITTSPIEKILVTDTIRIPEGKRFEKLEQVSVASIFGEAIRRIHNEESISVLFSLKDEK